MLRRRPCGRLRGLDALPVSSGEDHPCNDVPDRVKSAVADIAVLTNDAGLHTKVKKSSSLSAFHRILAPSKHAYLSAGQLLFPVFKKSYESIGFP